jgi:exo-poly-alpha-galacturonosidase
MKNTFTGFLCTLLFFLMHVHSAAASVYASGSPGKLIAPPNTTTTSSITLLWDKPMEGKATAYIVYMNGKKKVKSLKTNCTISGLKPGKSYRFYVCAVDSNGIISAPGNVLVLKTKTRQRIFNILDYGAKADSSVNNTAAIQRAIDACTKDGIVLVPEGQFISGALFLKSNMTLQIEKGGELKASQNLQDYLPMVRNRFEGWELDTYASLINAGKLDRNAAYTIENIAIRGQGRITGGGSQLGNAMINANGIRSRGRLICIMNARNVEVQGLTLEDSHCWTLHYIYSSNISCHDLTINSFAINGDGIDPDSSIDSYIFNNIFSTADDCIAIKSGKNPEGNLVNRPTENVFISDCKFIRGLGLAIGSEMSGGVRNVVIRDCEVGNLKEGIQIKSRKDRGGFVENIRVRDCDLLRIKIETTITYNSDGEAAPELPHFRNIEFSNLDMSKGKTGKALIMVDGFPDPGHYTSNVSFSNIMLPPASSITVNYSKDVRFTRVICADGSKPAYKITNSEKIEK